MCYIGPPIQSSHLLQQITKLTAGIVMASFVLDCDLASTVHLAVSREVGTDFTIISLRGGHDPENLISIRAL